MIISCNTRRKVGFLATMCVDIDQKERDFSMREFQSGSSRVLILTSFLARGTEVQQVCLVINFDFGRSGRFGRMGAVISFEVDFLPDQLQRRDFTISTMHAELNQKQRDYVMRDFQSGSSRVLITND